MDNSPFLVKHSFLGLRGLAFKCSLGLFGIGNNLHVYIPTAVKQFQLIMLRYSEEIPVRQEQEISTNTSNTICIFRHMHHMGSTVN